MANRTRGFRGAAVYERPEISNLLNTDDNGKPGSKHKMVCGYHPIEDEVDDLRVRVKNLTSKLCCTCNILEANNLLPKELEAWWQKHKLEDLQERQKSSVAAAAMATLTERKEYLDSVRQRLTTQLTDEEKEALGIVIRPKDEKQWAAWWCDQVAGKDVYYAHYSEELAKKWLAKASNQGVDCWLIDPDGNKHLPQ